ncbi:MAG: ribbon-helix-helix protein, CopG family [Candidatus Lokiarchaeota archaeon]|jgi:CopG family nickel-responsive transcriptional regulator|nr:ribbon-helix-helix protein, CopG family [Candidatus Lokiarchaeota archaeon]MBD3201502.1 ribbon-helix-helix protein, CopG family [Candidatus Lokiarchaeota archaeon]
MPIISLQVSDGLLERFESVRKSSGFSSKSEALREAIANFIQTYETFENLEGYRIMTVSLVYPFKDVIINQLSEIYSQYHKIIKNISDWRIANKKIELLLLVGEFGLIKDLKIMLSEVKDVIYSIHEVIID